MYISPVKDSKQVNIVQSNVLENYISQFKKQNNPDKKLEHTNKVFALTNTGTVPMKQRLDGGYLLDKETSSLCYYGKDAINFLKKNTFFQRETEIISPSNCILKITTAGESFTFSNSGAILIGPGTNAKVEVLEGTPFIVSSMKQPDWYKKLGPDGDFKSNFEELARINKDLYSGHVQKRRFEGNQLGKLLEAGVLKDYNNDFVTWNNFRNPENLINKLKELNFNKAEIEKLKAVWVKSKEMDLQGREAGKIHNKDLREDITQKLVDAGLLKRAALNPEKLFWKSFSPEYEVRDKLNSIGIWNNDQEDVIRLWKNTTKAGYDSTGLVWEKGKVVVYSLPHKANMWTQENTEWIVNSTEYAGENQPFTLGASNVVAPKEYKEPIPFHDMRPAECLHRHPHREDRKQTEVYHVTSGKAALLTIQNGQPNISVLQPGDLAVITPGVVHCVMAIQGNYEHITTQIPSAFQYGFYFKEPQNYHDFSSTEQQALKMALEALK